MSCWAPFGGGSSLAQRGSEGGLILRDDEHQLGSRITLEEGGSTPFSITCGIYGWMFHTRFCGGQTEASAEFDRMKESLSSILALIPRADDPQAEEKCRAVTDSITAFVERFP